MKRFLLIRLLILIGLIAGLLNISAAPDKPLLMKEVPFIGAWQPAHDSILLDEYAFSDISNMRYMDKGIRGVAGYSKINTSAISTYTKIRNGFHYHQDQPADSRVIVQAYNSGETASQLFENTTAIPSQGNFSGTAIHTDASGAGIGRFAAAPQGNFIYCNGEESMIGCGGELRVSGFINYDPGDSFSYDYTNHVQSTLQDAENTAILNSTDGGLDSHTMLLLHVDNNTTDSSLVTPHTVTNYGVSNASVDNEDCSNITDWTDQDNNGDSSQVSYDSRSTMKLDSGTAGSGNKAQRYQDVGDLGATAYVSTLLYHSALGTIADTDYANLDVSCGTGVKLQARFATDGLFLYEVDGGGTWHEVGTDIVETGKWQEWTFAVSGPNGSEICQVYLNGLPQGSPIDISDIVDGHTAGEVTIAQNGTTTANRITYIDWIKIGTSTTTVTFDDGKKVFGTHSISLVGSGEYLACPDNADFDLSDGTFTIDGRIRLNPITTNQPIYWQQTTNNNYIKLYVNTDGAIVLSVFDSGSEVLGTSGLVTANSTIISNIWYHIEAVEDGDNWYIFVDGVQEAYLSDDSRAANYTCAVNIGNDSITTLNGRIDEFRVSDIARHTSAFEIPSAAYTDSTTVVNLYLGANRPLEGFKFYSKIANASTSTMSAYYWSGSAWTEVSSLSDGTSSGGISLAQTGSVTFASTDGSARVKHIDGRVLYWYKIIITAVSANTAIYYVTCNPPLQNIKNIWYGEPSTTVACKVTNGTTYTDYTLEINSTNTAYYAVLDSLGTSSYLLLGFLQPQLGFNIFFVPNKENDNPALLSVKYWTGATWSTVGTVEDGTLKAGTDSFAQTGVITFNPLTRDAEFSQTINGEGPYYWYKLHWSANLDSEVYVNYISGIQNPENVDPYTFPLMYQNRTILCNRKGQPNEILISAENSPDVYNGSDSVTYQVGGNDTLTAGVGVYNQFESSIYKFVVLTKKTETWILNGFSPATFGLYRISDMIGCPAPLTMDTCEVGYQVTPQALRNVAVWLSYDGPVVFDGSTMMQIRGMEPYFDPQDSRCINYSYIDKSIGFFDSLEKEYNLLIPSGSGQTTCNVWLILDIPRGKWTKKEPAAYPQSGWRVEDLNGAQYCYLGFDDGHTRRNENGTAWDTTAIDQSVTLKEMFLAEQSMWYETLLDFLKLYTKAENGGTETVSVYHRTNGDTAWTSLNTVPMYATGKRYSEYVQRVNTKGVGHEIKLAMSSAEYVFEPIALGLMYSVVRRDTRLD